MPRLAVVLDDPRLASARERHLARDPSGAARALEAARGSATIDPQRSCTWAYAAGRLHLEAGEASEAVSAFEHVLQGGGDASAPCALLPYASLRDAQALLRLARPEEAIARAKAVGDDVAARDEARLALADAYVAKGDRASAVPVWRTLLAAAPHGLRWADSSLQLAGALLDGLDGPAEPRAQEALDLATRVLVESPSAAEKVDVPGLRGRAASLLKLRAAPILTPDERVRQAQAWADASQPKRAADAAEALLKAIPKGDKKHHEAACKAAVVRAQSVPRGKAGEAADSWGEAMDRCDGEDALVTALYYGGKASTSAHRNAEALSRFDRVEKRFPKHRLADDARFHAALVTTRPNTSRCSPRSPTPTPTAT
jgi:soluble lytic murein transglycosylase